MVLIVYAWSVIYRNMMKKLSVNQVELFVLHLRFVCVGIKCQRKVKKTPGVIKILEIRGDVKIHWLQPPYSSASCSQHRHI